jgi:hypothetical protein
MEIGGVREVKRVLQPLSIRCVKKGFEVGAQTQEKKVLKFYVNLKQKTCYHGEKPTLTNMQKKFEVVRICWKQKC